MTAPPLALNEGRRATLMIDGLDHVVGLSQVRVSRDRQVWMAAYMPRTTYRFKAGDDFVFESLRFIVTQAGQSPHVPKMALLTLDLVPTEEVG